MSLVSNLKTASGKAYVVNEDGFVPGALQYIDRDYTFDYIPDVVLVGTHIRTAGNDKFINENDACLCFEVAVPVTVYVLYADKLRVLPNWLHDFTDTREKVTRSDANVSTLKGIFTLFAKQFEPGHITLNGNLSMTMANDAKFQAAVGTNYCMYSVVVKSR